jgi:hypothetical protein
MALSRSALNRFWPPRFSGLKLSASVSNWHALQTEGLGVALRHAHVRRGLVKRDRHRRHPGAAYYNRTEIINRDRNDVTPRRGPAT